MPELPDITVYLEALDDRIAGRVLTRIRLRSIFALRTVAPAPVDLEGRVVERVFRIGKRIVIAVENDCYIVIHLMIAGRLWWRERGIAIPAGRGLAAFDFDSGSLLLTEAGKKKRASIHLVRGQADLAEFDRGGLPIHTDGRENRPDAFARAMRKENHTLKRALTDPRILSGIGNAYSDEILFAAGLSPFKQTHALSEEEMSRLFTATVATLASWTNRLATELGGQFPEKVTAFRREMAVHGKYGEPCPNCGAPVQRIVYSGRESNYCPGCQTGGRVLADRALSRLLRSNWPKTIDELEQ